MVIMITIITVVVVWTIAIQKRRKFRFGIFVVTIMEAIVVVVVSCGTQCGVLERP